MSSPAKIVLLLMLFIGSIFSLITILFLYGKDINRLEKEVYELKMKEIKNDRK